MMLTIIGDSLALNRYDDGIFDHDLYAYKIYSNLSGNCFINNKAKRGNTTKNQALMLNLVEDVYPAKSDFFIIQLGICDCSPRLFRESERMILSVLSKIYLVKKLAAKFIKYKADRRYYFTKKKAVRLVDLPEYKTNINKIINAIIENNNIKKIYIINIAYPGNYLIERSYGILNSIKEYNNSLDVISQKHSDIIKIIDLFGVSEQNSGFIIEKDGHHITQGAHDWIAKQITNDMLSVIVGPVK